MTSEPTAESFAEQFGDKPVCNGDSFQSRVSLWMQACFGDEISRDIVERNHRFLEESLELVQSMGATASEAHQLVDYVFGRPVGEPTQETGGVMVTLAALCLAAGMDMDQLAEIELGRIWGKVEQIRAKQASKPKHSPLPQHPEPTYTMQQAVDKIVDGLVLEWDGRTERVAAKTVFGEYVVYLAGTESHGQWWSWHLEPVGGDYIANGEVDASGEDGRLKALRECLDDYKSRFRAEIEKAVAHG